MKALQSKSVWAWGLLWLAGCASGCASGSANGGGGNAGGGNAGNGTAESSGASSGSSSGQASASGAASGDGGAGGQDDDDEQPLASSSFGTPPVANARPRMRVTARWVTTDGRNRIVCEHQNPPPPAECPQCPLEPPTTVTTAAFERAESRVLRCNPPADRNGLLPVRAAFGANGLVQDVSFPHMNLDETMAVCLGRRLCRMRVPTFRSPQSIAGYEYQIYTAPTPTPTTPAAGQ